MSNKVTTTITLRRDTLTALRALYPHWSVEAIINDFVCRETVKRTDPMSYQDV